MYMHDYTAINRLPENTTKSLKFLEEHLSFDSRLTNVSKEHLPFYARS